jgi:hypothetical protein
MFQSGSHHSALAALSRPIALLLIFGSLLGIAAHPAYAAAGGDLGDAPDSTNNFGVGMTAWTAGPPARFPTVFFAGTQPTGPFHQNPTLLFHLGADVSCERQADSGPDCDGLNNIDPPANVANQDRFDDGIAWPILGNCQRIQVRYRVTVLPGAPANAYVNVWGDWTSNGAWGDRPTCNGMVADEWAVQNQVIALPGPGVFTYSTPAFLPIRTGRPQWARITISDAPASGAAARVGSGPASSWRYGETEDYVLP